MNEQDARILPRLWMMLDSLEDDADIANAVRKIRAVVGRGAFAAVSAKTATAADILFDHEDVRIRAVLRGLGFAIRPYGHKWPDVLAAKERVQSALIESGSIKRQDLLLFLVFIRELLRHQADAISQQESRTRPEMPRDDFDMNEIMGNALDLVRRQMGGE